MLLSMLTASVVAIYPVELSDPLLRRADTHVSDAARTLIGESNLGVIHCMDLPERSSRYARTCLTAGEWERVLQLAQADAAKQESVQARNRAIALASWYSR